MKIIISHSKTKRLIEGPFAICISADDLNELKAIIDTAIEKGHHYGWINIDELARQPLEMTFDVIKRQKHIINTEPSKWD